MKRASALLSIALVAGVVAAPAAFANEDLCKRYGSDPQFARYMEPPPSSIEGSTSHVYKTINGVDLRLHVFYPPAHRQTAVRANEKLPAIAFFFGGAWMIGTVQDSVAPARYLAERGMVAVVVDYRVYCRNKVDIVEEIADAKSAMRWLRAHADELGIDPNRLAASGGSSGGHIALSTAMFADLDEQTEDRAVSSRPNLLALFYPCVDETTEEEKSYGAPAIGTHGEDVSPLYHVQRGLPPTIIFVGTADTMDAEDKSYCSKAQTSGNHCNVIEYPGAPHGFFVQRANKDNKLYDESLAALDRYLTRAGYLRQPARSS